MNFLPLDAQARKQGLSPQDRQLLRLEQSKPLLEQINSQIQRARSDALPKSVLAKACNHTLTLWTRLSRFLEHSELELSNNLAENAMRPLALGRRNWINIGSEQAVPRVAAIASVVETCRRLKIPIRDYLGSVLPGLADFPINRIPELTPAAWLARNKAPWRFNSPTKGYLAIVNLLGNQLIQCDSAKFGSLAHFVLDLGWIQR
jgi:transposase